MKLNGIEISEDLLLRYGAVANAIGKDFSRVAKEHAVLREKLPGWVKGGHTEIFDLATLKEENTELADRILKEEDWLLGTQLGLVRPGCIDPYQVVLFAYDMGMDAFLAFNHATDPVSVIYMEDSSGGMSWVDAGLSMLDLISALEQQLP